MARRYVPKNDEKKNSVLQYNSKSCHLLTISEDFKETLFDVNFNVN